MHTLSNSLLGLWNMSQEDLDRILAEAAYWKQVGPVSPQAPLTGKMIANLFFEPSTRTSTSFQVAGQGLGAQVINFATGSSSLVKGESLEDTARTMVAMGVNLVVVRHQQAGVAQYLAQRLPIPIINAGDGANEHPTQGLLDMFTIKEHFGTIAGLRVVIVGDIRHSRVARSNMWGLLKMGAQVVVVGPPTLLPPGLKDLGVEVYTNLEGALPGAHVINILRLQRERQSAGLLASLGEYRRRWGITQERLELTGQRTLVLHPGPMNLGVEITPEVARGPQAAIEEQVTNGVAVRMALLNLMLGGGELAWRKSS